ncbi:MAG: anthranilate synthase component II [Acidimicrobiales bacterium]
MAAKVLLIDNYDSFVYNLVQEMGELGADPVVERNDAIDLRRIEALSPDGIVISPGPGRPESAGISMQVVAELGGKIPILGVCLGHQCIAQVFGARIVGAPTLMHGKTSEIRHDRTGLFAGLPDPLVATRYHSLVVEPGSVPRELTVTASAKDGVIMGLSHRHMPIFGVQFHPESVLTYEGPRLLENFLGSLES